MIWTWLQRDFWLFLGALCDILLVAYLVYRIWLLIRGTRAQQVLVGLVVIATSFAIANALGLRTLSWVLDNFIESFFLIAIVVFQHDIRRGLSKVGQRPLFGIGNLTSGSWLIDELVRATESMAKERVGALILLEREADLSELREAGTLVDARVSSSLLIQMFTSPGPLHDGAVIINDGRVAAAAVFVSLTQNPRVDPTLGTRHRAAIGATEEVDAIAIVVSEERGQISLAEGGILTRDLDADMLRKVLARHLGLTVRRTKSRRWRWFGVGR